MAKSAIDTMIKADDFITDVDASKAISDDFNSLFFKLAYKKFDARLVRKFLLKAASLSELINVAMCFLERGVNFTEWKSADFEKPETLNEIKAILVKLKMSRRKNGATMIPTDDGLTTFFVTPGRFMIALGDMVIKVISSLSNDVQKRLTSKSPVPIGMPYAYAWPGAASFLPNDVAKSRMFITWSIGFDYTITKVKKDWSFDEAFDRVTRYVEIGLKEPLITDRASTNLWAACLTSDVASETAIIKSIGGASMGFEDYLKKLGLTFEDVKLSKESIKRIKKVKNEGKSEKKP